MTRHWAVVCRDGSEYRVDASDAAAAIVYVVVIARHCEHRDVVRVEEV